MSDFLHMGGDGAYVWSAYGITLAVLLLNVWLTLRRRAAALERARERAREEAPTRKQPTVRRLP